MTARRKKVLKIILILALVCAPFLGFLLWPIRTDKTIIQADPALLPGKRTMVFGGAEIQEEWALARVRNNRPAMIGHPRGRPALDIFLEMVGRLRLDVELAGAHRSVPRVRQQERQAFDIWE